MANFKPSDHLTKIQGREYLEVKWRIVWFRDIYPQGTITTDVHALGDLAYIRARVIVDGLELASGIATLRAAGDREKTWAGRELEKAETAAIGRALAIAGYGTQFTNEIEEDGDLADSPVERKAKPAPSSPTGQPPDTNRTAPGNGNGKAWYTSADTVKLVADTLSMSIGEACKVLGIQSPAAFTGDGYPAFIEAVKAKQLAKTAPTVQVNGATVDTETGEILEARPTAPEHSNTVVNRESEPPAEAPDEPPAPQVNSSPSPFAGLPISQTPPDGVEVQLGDYTADVPAEAAKAEPQAEAAAGDEQSSAQHYTGFVDIVEIRYMLTATGRPQWQAKTHNDLAVVINDGKDIRALHEKGYDTAWSKDKLPNKVYTVQIRVTLHRSKGNWYIHEIMPYDPANGLFNQIRVWAENLEAGDVLRLTMPNGNSRRFVYERTEGKTLHGKVDKIADTTTASPQPYVVIGGKKLDAAREDMTLVENKLQWGYVWIGSKKLA